MEERSRQREEVVMHGEERQAADPITHIFEAWDAALGARDLDASMALYHPDATLESPLVRYLLGTSEGIVCGRENLRAFVAKVFAGQPPERQRFRMGFLTDGSHLTWECCVRRPGASPPRRRGRFYEPRVHRTRAEISRRLAT